MRSKDDARLILEPSGDVRVEGASLRHRLGQAAGQYEVIEADPSLLFLSKLGDRRSRVLMAGEIVARSTMMEVLSIVAQNGWGGEMCVTGPHAQRRLSLADGALKAAWSSMPSERLGEVMARNGMLTPEQLARCVLDTSGRRFGEIAVASGYATQEVLYEALRKQMQVIFQSALLEEQGHYALLRHHAEDAAANLPAVLMHLPLQRLLMESVQRVDEMALFRERIPAGDVCPVITARAARISIADSLRPVLALADGERTILEMAKALRSDEYATTKRVCQLLQIGAIELRQQRTLDAASARRLLVRFNQVLKRIFDTVALYRKRDAIRLTLESWIASSELRRFFEGALLPEGTLDLEQAMLLLDDLQDERPLELLHQALHELTGFALLSASSVLPRDAERSLSRIVDQKLAHLRRLGD